jgi:hypothetical protein
MVTIYRWRLFTVGDFLQMMVTFYRCDFLPTPLFNTFWDFSLSIQPTALLWIVILHAPKVIMCMFTVNYTVIITLSSVVFCGRRQQGRRKNGKCEAFSYHIFMSFQRSSYPAYYTDDILLFHVTSQIVSFSPHRFAVMRTKYKSPPRSIRCCPLYWIKKKYFLSKSV